MDQQVIELYLLVSSPGQQILHQLIQDTSYLIIQKQPYDNI
jgi:hypothetical protein